jgi:4-hydroxy-2-oxoheptanedioate aldolase
MTQTPFSLARRLRAGETVFSAWCSLASPIVAEAIAREGFPAVVIDVQHGLWDIAATMAAIGAVNHAGAAPVVRVPLNDFAFVSRALDAGAEAIIAPMINTPSDARTFAAVAKFPPLGERSWGPQRAMVLQARTVSTDYLREANEGTLTLAMIETPMALANVEDIAASDGIDALFIGPYDLSTALSGGKAQDVQAPEVERAIDRIGEAARKAGKIPGVYCRDAERALAMAKRGFRFVTVGSDLGLVREGAAAQVKALKG